jgi:hypothetical protein
VTAAIDVDRIGGIAGCVIADGHAAIGRKIQAIEPSVVHAIGDHELMRAGSKVERERSAVVDVVVEGVPEPDVTGRDTPLDPRATVDLKPKAIGR